MKILNIFEGLIRETQITGQSEKCIKMFGKEIFSPQLGGKEPNTDYEREVLDDIFNFTLINYGATISPEFIKATKNLKGCMSSYPEVLHPEGVVYRGTKMPLGKFLQITYKPNQWNKIEYLAHTPIQSWTESFDVGEDFALTQINKYTNDALIYLDNANDEDVKVLLQKQPDILDKFNVSLLIKHNATPDQFLFKAKYFNYLSGAGDNVGDFENEILRIDNRPIVVDGIIPDELEGRMINAIEKIKKAL